MSINMVNADGSLSRLAGGTLYADAPIGAIVSFGGTTAPSGWLLCQGQAVSRTTYAELFNAIGTAFGSGDGSTTFNVPDLREATTKGVGLTGKSSNHYDSDGVALGEFVEDRIKSHQHTITSIFAPGSVTVAGTYTVNQTSEDMLQVAPAGASTNEVKAVGVNYIIKAIQVGVPQDVLAEINKVTTGTPTMASGVSNVDCNWKKIGKLVIVEGTINITSTIATNANKIIANGFPKPTEETVVMYMPINNDDCRHYIDLLSDGTLRASARYTSMGNYYRISVTYISAD